MSDKFVESIYKAVNPKIKELEAENQRLRELLGQTAKALEDCHPMNPEEQCYIYDIWQAAINGKK